MARSEGQPGKPDTLRIIEMVNRTRPPYGQNRWAANKGITEPIQSKEIKDESSWLNKKSSSFAKFLNLDQFSNLEHTHSKRGQVLKRKKGPEIP